MICPLRRHLQRTLTCFPKDFQPASKVKSPRNLPKNLKQPCSKKAKKMLKHLLRNKESLMRTNGRNLRLNSKRPRKSSSTRDKSCQPKRLKALPTLSARTRKRSNRCTQSSKECFKIITAPRTRTTKKSSRLSTIRTCSKTSTSSDALTFSWTSKTTKASLSLSQTHSPLGNQKMHIESILIKKKTRLADGKKG